MKHRHLTPILISLASLHKHEAQLLIENFGVGNIRTNPVVALALRIEIVNAFQVNTGLLLCSFTRSRHHQIEVVRLIAGWLMVEFNLNVAIFGRVYRLHSAKIQRINFTCNFTCKILLFLTLKETQLKNTQL